MSIPRVLSLSQGHLLQHPAPEIEQLRGQGRVWEKLEVGGELDLGKWGNALELRALIQPSARPLTFDIRPFDKLRASSSTNEVTQLILDCNEQQLKLNPFTPDRPTLTMPFKPKDLMELRVFLDASVIEVFLEGQTLTSRMYPVHSEGIGLSLSGAGSLERLEVYPLG